MVLAVDGGGTRCRVALSDDQGTTVAETGCANVSTDFDGGIREILKGLNDLARASKIAPEVLKGLPTFVGLAGVTGPAMADRLHAALPFNIVRIEDDRPAALRGALGARDGVIAHCGTGSFYGVQIDGEMRLSGGWGPVLGDEASAQWIGRTALGVALETVDGRSETSDLAEALLDKFKGAPGIVRFATTADPKSFGALAPEVTEAARHGDALAIHVMRAGAAEITRSLVSIGWRPGLALCLTGGIGHHFGSYLAEDMRIELEAPLGPPLEGAIALARDLAKEHAR
ncbi:MAG: BadF/BadG/BcrA/BcrD ATPase family protein [Pseudomonadota bacterium]